MPERSPTTSSTPFSRIRRSAAIIGDPRDRRAWRSPSTASAAIEIKRTPLRGDGWVATTACCTPNVHRDLRIAVDGRRVATPETFAVDWARVKGDRLHDGDGTRNEEFYDFGTDVHAVADSKVVFIQEGKPEQDPGSGDGPR